jgi:hypothetical protein
LWFAQFISPRSFFEGGGLFIVYDIHLSELFSLKVFPKINLRFEACIATIVKKIFCDILQKVKKLFDLLVGLDFSGVNDEAFAQLRIVTDINGDGMFGKDEYLTLLVRKIESINLNNFTNGGEIEGGETGLIQEEMPVPKEVLDVPEDIQVLPSMAGAGTLYSWHQAMARD